MGSENAADFEVRKPRLRKRTKRKVSPEETLENNEVVTEEKMNDGNMVLTKRKGRKRKANNRRATTDKEVDRETEKETIKSEEQNDNNAEVMDELQKRVQPVNEVKPAKRTKRSNNITETLDPDPVSPDEGQAEVINTVKDNTKNSKPSKRQLKREKAEQRETEKREASRLEATEKGLNYVSKWKYNRTEWKFEKLRQIWLMDHLLDENSIPDTMFPIVLEYFEGCKGMAREQLLRTGMDVIRKAEENVEKKDEVMNSVAYKRARKLLQALPTET